MALPFVTYTDYKEYGGLLSEEDFSRSLKAACAYVRYLIGFNEPEDETQESAYINAVCAACDVDAAYGHSSGIGEGLSSFSIGSVSFGSNASGVNGSDSYQTDMRRAISLELSISGLLYQGVG